MSRPARPSSSATNSSTAWPIRQFVRDGNDWRERQVGLDALRRARHSASARPPTSRQRHPGRRPGRIRAGAGNARRNHRPPLPRSDPAAPCSSTTARTIVRPAIRCAPSGPASRSIRWRDPGHATSPPMSTSLASSALPKAQGLAVHGPIQQSYFLTRLGARERARVAGERQSAAAPTRSPRRCRSWSRRREMGRGSRRSALRRTASETPPGF